MTSKAGAVTITAILLFALTLAISPATAQVADPRNQTTAEPTTSVQNQLGDLVVHDYSYDASSGTMTIDMTWSGDRPETVTLTEMIELDQEGSTTISFKTVRLMPGERHSVEIGAEMSSGTAAVMLTTTQSVEANNALVLQSGDGTDRDPVPFNYAAGFVGLAALGGAGMAFGLTARNYLNADDDEPEVERIA